MLQTPCLVFLLIFAVVHATNLGTPGAPVEWEKCAQIPILNETCLLVEAFPDNLTIIGELLIRNHSVFREELNGTDICVNDNVLLDLIGMIPALKPFEEIIKWAEALFGKIPGDIFSICLVTSNVKWTSTSVSACFALDTTIMCWKGKCLHKGVHNYGCFTKPIHG